ncbi:hypothetical protein BDV12DRAFT_86385 [Aspergillus spectabilis]
MALSHGHQGSKSLTHDDYTVGWICALPVEMAAARIMLDKEHPKLPKPPTDSNTYTLGEIQDHHIVIACLPFGIYGTTSAAVVATQMLSTFPAIRFGLMVGIGGGVPTGRLDIRLGDIAVSKGTGLHGGVVQYDYGKTVQGGRFERSGTLNKPPAVLLTGVASLEAECMLQPSFIATCLQEKMERFEQIGGFMHPGVSADHLYEATYDHPEKQDTCDKCDVQCRIQRQPRATPHPKVHYGVIASGNQVMKHGRTRHKLAEELGIICFEMEAAGLMDTFPCLVIRGISDYADSHKNKRWQGYAAATAAAYAKALLSVTSVSMTKRTHKVVEALQREKFRVDFDIRNVPISSFFIGRDRELSHLWESLAPEASKLRKVATIYGMGGIGKTQLAIQFARLHREAYTAVFWLNAKNRESLVQSLAMFVLHLASLDVMTISPGTHEEYESLAKQMLGWLAIAENSGWLLILDNVEQYPSGQESDGFGMLGLFPSADHGSIIITTRHAQWTEIGIPCFVQKLKLAAATELLITCSRTRMEQGEERPLTKVDSHMTRLLDRLDGLPLAIVIAGSFISRTGMGFAKYLQHYEESWRNLMSKAGPKGDYDNGDMLTTWTVSYREIMKRNRESARLLLLLSCFSNQDIWYDLLSNAALAPGVPRLFREALSDEINFSTTIQVLLDFSMIEAHPMQNNYSIHPVIQDWCQSGANAIDGISEPKQALKEMQCLALVAVGNSIPMSTEKLYWTVQHRLMPHATRLMELFKHSWDKVDSSEALLFAVHMLGIMYQDQGRINEANQLFQLALHGRESLLGADHANTLASANNLAILYRTQGKLHEAATLFTRVRDSRERTLGCEHPSTIRVVLNLGNVYADQNKLEEAKRMYKRVLEYRLREFGAEHSLTLNVFQNLAIIYRVEGQFERAGEIYHRVLAVREVTLGPHHTDTLNIVNNLGNLYLDQGKLPLAETMLLRALEGREQAIGREHTDTLGTINGLGNLYLQQGRLTEAENMYQEALSGRRYSQGIEHINTLETTKNIGNLYMKLGKLTQAEKLYEATVEGYVKIIGKDKIDTMTAMHGLANAYREQGRLDKAEALYEEILSNSGPRPGERHWSALLVVHDLANLFLRKGDLRRAEEMYDNAFHGLQQTIGGDHPSILQIMVDQGDLCVRQGKLTKAYQLYLRAKEGLEEQLGINHISTLHVLQTLGTLLERQRKYTAAKEIYQVLLTRRQNTIGLGDSDILQAADQIRNVEQKILEQVRIRALFGVGCFSVIISLIAHFFLLV